MDEIKIVERPLQEVMEHAITLEESERRLTEMIHNYYHEDKVEKITYDENYVAMVREAAKGQSHRLSRAELWK